ncbi:MAG: hypothetical protein EOO46_20705 [Flavobacterium sp.]|nr:MAG: hypothetical protein EOO46_20705 [Flavobacterium sp.]
MRKFVFIVIFCTVNLYSQKNYPIKWESSITGIFEVTKIDTLDKEYHIWIKLKYLLNADKYKDNIIPENYYALILSFKNKKEKALKKHSNEKLKIGAEYYFDLEHYYFFHSMHPAPNTMPYAYGDWPDYLWKEESDFGLYESKQVNDLFYIK